MKLPTIFLSHGSPMLALASPEIDPYVRALHELGPKLLRPRAIAMISAHWYTTGRRVSVSAAPETIHDFYGFPDELYRVQYDVPGFPEGFDLLRKIDPDTQWIATDQWLDHGAWTVLRHLFSEADIPVFSLSVDRLASPREHFDLWVRLRGLREEGILLVANGNIVHSLADARFDPVYAQIGSPQTIEFDTTVRDLIDRRRYDPLFDPWSLPSGRYAVPTLEHYLPLLTILGTSYPDEAAEWIYTGYELNGISRSAFGFFGK